MVHEQTSPKFTVEGTHCYEKNDYKTPIYCDGSYMIRQYCMCAAFESKINVPTGTIKCIVSYCIIITEIQIILFGIWEG